MLITDIPKITRNNTGFENAIINDKTFAKDNKGTIKYHLGGFMISS
jgi:hypothetical protein